MSCIQSPGQTLILVEAFFAHSDLSIMFNARNTDRSEEDVVPDFQELMVPWGKKIANMWPRSALLRRQPRRVGVWGYHLVNAPGGG